MGEAFTGEKYVPLYSDRGRPVVTVLFCLFLAFLILLPTARAHDHFAGFREGMGAAFTIAFWTLAAHAALGVNRVTRLFRIGDTLHVTLRSYIPGIPRGYLCPVRDAYAWQKLGTGLQARLVFYSQGKRYFASLAGGGSADAHAIVSTYPELASAFGIRRPPTA